MKNATIIASLSAAILAGAVSQGLASGDDDMPRGHGPRHSFEELDADADGRITPAEMQAHMQGRFEAADADGDGQLTREELDAQASKAQAERRARFIDMMMERADTDDSGTISMDEMQAARQMRHGMMFQRIDADGDGMISKEEFAEMRKRHGMGHRHGMKAD
ncbi:MAG: EF-hand domain-containing protein [Roseovarius sp.]